MAQVTRIQSQLRRRWPPIGGPITSTLFLLGLVVVLVAAALRTGVWAGILGILGFLMIAIAVVSRALILVYKAL